MSDDLPETLSDSCQLYPMVLIADGNPIGWTIRTLEKKLPKMLSEPATTRPPRRPMSPRRAAFSPRWKAAPERCLPPSGTRSNIIGGTDIFDAGILGLGLKCGGGGKTAAWPSTLTDIGGLTGRAYVEETEILAFDCFWQFPHYHDGPRNKNHRIFSDKTLVEDPLGWVFEQFENRKLGAMIDRAGYRGSRPISTSTKSPPFSRS